MKKDVMMQIDVKDMQDRRVKINEGSTSYSGRYKGRMGTIVRPGADSIGVKIDNEKPNQASSYGVYWFKRREMYLLPIANDKAEVEKLMGVIDTSRFDDAMTRLGDIVSKAFVHPLIHYAADIVDCRDDYGNVYKMKLGNYNFDELAVLASMHENSLTQHEFDAYICGRWEAKLTTKEDIMRIVELAKERDIKMICDKNAQTINDLLDADEVIQAMNKKRELAGQKPLSYSQKVGICTAETDELMKKAQEEADKAKYDLDIRYTELEAALELPEVNVIEVLKAAGVLNENGTGLA